ncbi:MAG: H-X9-DG-CTERM domain-containing protein [Planctomycetota bacterium]|jgi:prepilin-type processing-associated H-X9-DG protein
MEEKKKFINPLTWAWLVLLLIGIAYIIAWIINALTQIFEHNNIFDNFPLFRTLVSTLLFIFYALSFVIFIGSSVSLFRLIIKKVSTKKPYVYVIISMAGSIFIFGALFMNFRCRTLPRGYLCRGGLDYLSECFLETFKRNDINYQKMNWCDSLKSCFGEDDSCVYLCPMDKTGPCSYAMNENIPADAGELPGDLVLLFESAPGWNQVGGADDVVTDRHGKPGANIAFADGHVEFVKAEDIPILRWTVDE